MAFPQNFVSELLGKPDRNGQEVQPRCHKYTSLVLKPEEVSNQTLIFHSEGALLKSSSLFPYFMLVAFEAGGLLRALVLFVLYPFVCLSGEDLGLKIMVFLCFFGIRKERFRIGTAVLPKMFLEDVGCEGFDVVMSFGKKVGVSDLPRIMVEGFLKDYLGVEAVVARELMVVCGYFVGLLEEKKENGIIALNKILGEEKTCNSHAIGIASCYKKSLDQQLFSHCKEVYLVNEAEKRNWHILPRQKYPKPLIFHDGRLAFRPTLLATLAMFMWIPLGFFLSLIRLTAGLFLPFGIKQLILAFSGIRTTTSRPKSYKEEEPKGKGKDKGILYACNHRTLLDPLYVQVATNKPLSAVTYSLSKFSEVISPIRTVSLSRDREKDKETMEKLLSQGDLVVCPEGTTCREPYLLRFSSLFAEMTDDIVPVALDVQVSMFHGTTASGHKCLDPLFQLMNPYYAYSVNILDKLPPSHTCKVGGKTMFEVANYVQYEIARALGFQCTGLTRKDKYLILAGNEGIIRNSTNMTSSSSK